ncbi:MAG: hypothetical protein LBN97_07710 [Oscillospiraceae bacterium]|jgi:hypothetical protein|nr:hypothetical protein [Oscillospiraceae bacterium]
MNKTLDLVRVSTIQIASIIDTLETMPQLAEVIFAKLRDIAKDCNTGETVEADMSAACVMLCSASDMIETAFQYLSDAGDMVVFPDSLRDFNEMSVRTALLSGRLYDNAAKRGH